MMIGRSSASRIVNGGKAWSVKWEKTSGAAYEETIIDILQSIEQYFLPHGGEFNFNANKPENLLKAQAKHSRALRLEPYRYKLHIISSKLLHKP
ncbi:hypothetical protein [Paenibacillus sp. JJ1683]